MTSPFRIAKRYLARYGSSELPRKGKHYDGVFQGDDDGKWELAGYYRHHPNTWDASMGLNTRNEARTLMVEGATEHNSGFLKALHEMVREYPELRDFDVKFDGPWMPLTKLLSLRPRESKEPDWTQLTFYHGTSSTAASIILRDGLRPRSQTNVAPAYGASANAPTGHVEAIYLTTQLSMARYAANDAARGRGTAVVLEVKGIDPAFVAADEDSRETEAAASLARLGSIAYMAPIPASKVRLIWEDS